MSLEALIQISEDAAALHQDQLAALPESLKALLKVADEARALQAAAFDLWQLLPSCADSKAGHGDQYADMVCGPEAVMHEACIFLGHGMAPNAEQLAEHSDFEGYYRCACGQDHDDLDPEWTPHVAGAKATINTLGSLARAGQEVAGIENEAFSLWTWLPSHKAAQERLGDYASNEQPDLVTLLKEAAAYIRQTLAARQAGEAADQVAAG
jgi:hypothetical protein